MRTTAFVLLLVLCAATAGALGVREEKLYDAPPTPGGEPVPIESSGVGPVKYTMTPDQVMAVLGNPDEIYYGDTRYTRDDNPSAAHYVFRSAGLSVFFVLGRLRYIAVLSEQYEYPGGVRVGMDAARAEEILGPFPENEGAPGSGPTYIVSRDGDLYYRVVPYYDRGLSLKIDVTTGRVLQLRLLSHDSGRLRYFEEIDDRRTEDMSWSRRTDAESMKELGIDLGRYTLVVKQFGFRAVDDRSQPQITATTRYYYLKGVTEAEITRQEAVLRQSSGMFDADQPTALAVVRLLGMPMSIMVYGDFLGLVGTISYGQAFMEIMGSPWMVRSLGSLEYRYRGRIGPGSTLENVFTELGEPVRVETSGANTYTFDDRVLATIWEDQQIIAYRDAGVVVEATRGVVTWVRRIWEW